MSSELPQQHATGTVTNLPDGLEAEPPAVTATSALTGADQRVPAVAASGGNGALPDQQPTLFEWQGMLHVGHVRRPYPEKPYIVYVAKQPDPVSARTAAELRRKRTMPVLKVSPRVEFSGSSYLLGVTGDTLCVLSGEDILYCHVHPRQPAGETFRTGAELVGFDSP